MNLQELREQKGRLAEEADQILKAAAADGRQDLRSDEETKFDTIHGDIEKLTSTIVRQEKQDAVLASLESTGRRSEPSKPNTETRQRAAVGQANQHDVDQAMRGWLVPEGERNDQMRASAARVGVNLDAGKFKFKLSPVALRANTEDGIAEWKRRNDEFRAAMGTTSGSVGQYTVPDATMQALERAMLAFGGMRSVATVIRTDTGASLPFPTTDDTANKGAILTENNQVSEVDITFGQLTLDSYLYSSKSVLISLQLLQDTSINVSEMIGSMLGERIGRIQNDHFTTGTGSSQPNGIVTAATSSSVTLAGTATVSYDNIVDLIHSVDPAYRDNGRFMFHDGALKMIKKVKVLQYSGDTVGAPLWTPGLVASQPDLILGYPYTINQSMTTPATGVKSILFGDLSKYLIRDVREVTLVRLNERYADYHQVGFLAFARSDGDLLDAGTHPVKYATQA